jgi:DNA-binding response OmpR family regulator
MPGRDGFEVLAELRRTSGVPVIMLTARKEEYDRLHGFNLGADDYVAKPFSPRELMARVAAVLRRTAASSSGELVFGGLEISELSRSVKVDGADAPLTPKEFDLLLYMAKHNHAAHSRDRILKNVWGFDYYGDTRTVDTHVKSLRERLGRYRGLIATVWGVGYRFEYNDENAAAENL